MLKQQQAKLDFNVMEVQSNIDYYIKILKLPMN